MELRRSLGKRTGTASIGASTQLLRLMLIFGCNVLRMPLLLLARPNYYRLLLTKWSNYDAGNSSVNAATCAKMQNLKEGISKNGGKLKVEYDVK